MSHSKIAIILASSLVVLSLISLVVQLYQINKDIQKINK